MKFSLNIFSYQKSDGACTDVLGVSHLDQLLPLFVGQVPAGQAGVPLVEGSPEQAKVVAHLGADHEVVVLGVELEHQRLLAVSLHHCEGLICKTDDSLNNKLFLKITVRWIPGFRGPIHKK